MNKQILSALILFISFTAFSQKVKVIEGDWQNLSGITQYSVVFDYENLKVNRFENEEAFLKELSKRFEDKNKSKTEKTVREIWFEDRKKRYEPKFIESFNKRFNDNQVFIDIANDNANYIVIVKTTKIVAGITNGTMNKSGKLDALVTIYKKDAPEKILLSVKYTRVMGNNAIPIEVRPGYNVAESYGKLGKEVAQKIKSKAW